MRAAVDRAGKIALPQRLRDALSLEVGSEVEISLAVDRIEIVPASRRVTLRRGPHGVLTSELDAPPQGPEDVRDALERVRR